MKLIDDPNLMPKLRIGDAKPMLSHIPLWHAQEQLYFTKHESLLSPRINMENIKKIHFCNGSSNTDMLRYTQILTTVEENVSEGLETGTVKPDHWPLLISSHHRTI